jgi:hypothetical protein
MSHQFPREVCFEPAALSSFESSPLLQLGLPTPHPPRIPTAGERLHATALSLATTFQPSAAASFNGTAQTLKIPMPGPKPGFAHSIVTLGGNGLQLRGELSIDERAVTSILDANHNSSALAAYRDKLPIMLLNRSRLHYTVEAFAMLQRTVDGVTPTQQALRFYLETDQQYSHRDLQLPANERFSQMLHRLRANGYESYIFELARAVRANVDLVVGDVSRVVGHRYLLLTDDEDNGTTTTLTGGGTTAMAATMDCRLKSNNSPANGFITALTDNGDYWCVKTTLTPYFGDPLPLTPQQHCRNHSQQQPHQQQQQQPYQQ